VHLPWHLRTGKGDQGNTFGEEKRIACRNPTKFRQNIQNQASHAISSSASAICNSSDPHGPASLAPEACGSSMQCMEDPSDRTAFQIPSKLLDTTVKLATLETTMAPKCRPQQPVLQPALT
jgi:hypothetical protein